MWDGVFGKPYLVISPFHFDSEICYADAVDEISDKYQLWLHCFELNLNWLQNTAVWIFLFAQILPTAQ